MLPRDVKNIWIGRWKAFDVENSFYNLERCFIASSIEFKWAPGNPKFVTIESKIWPDFKKNLWSSHHGIGCHCMLFDWTHWGDGGEIDINFWWSPLVFIGHRWYSWICVKYNKSENITTGDRSKDITSFTISTSLTSITR